MADNGAKKKASTTSDSGPRFVLATIVLTAALVVYGVAVLALWGEVDAAEPDWTRRVFLLTGIEAITFAAVGWLFGREVNHGAAETAKEAQGKAEDKMEEAATERRKGRDIADLIRCASSEDNVQTELGVTGASATASQFRTLLEFANRLYPEA
jgi:hypothetical protein